MKKFPEGIYAKKPHENAPDFVIANISIEENTLSNWLSEQKEAWINLELLKGKNGKYYLALNEWKPSKVMENNDPATADITDDDVPF